jgi:hypothetical protein
MPLTLDREPRTAERLAAAIQIRKQIDQLERRFAKLFATMPKYLLARNDYGFSADEMKNIARKLHAKAKQRIAGGRSKEFRGSIEQAL